MAMDNVQLTAELRGLRQGLQVMEDQNNGLQQQNAQLQANLDAAQVDRVDATRRIQALEAVLGGGPGPGIRPAAAGAAGAPAGGPPRNPRMLNISFEGRESDDWISFRQAFENACRFQDYGARHAKWALKGCMKNTAFLAISDINHEDDAETVEQLLGRYEEKFMPPAASDMARARFETAVQQPKESILQWHGRLRMLWTRAYAAAVGGWGGGVGDAILIRTFARGLRTKKVREHVLRSQPNTYDDALQAAQTEQAVADSCNYIPGSTPAFATNIGGSHHGGAHHGGAEPMEIGAMGTGKIQCHTCHLFGHIARECSLQKKPSKGLAAPATAGASGASRFTKGRSDGKPKGKGEPEKKGQKRTRFIHAIADAIANINLEEEEDEEEEEEEVEEGDEEEDPVSEDF
jgi:hypothetical protein